MNEAANRLTIGPVLSGVSGNLTANVPLLAALVLGAGVLGGLADTASVQAGNLAANIILFFVGLVASFRALKTHIGDAEDIQPHGGRVFGISFLSSLGILLGLILFVVPGLMLFARWAVAVPAMMRENLGVTEALSRSGDLTRGSRWPILGLGLLIWVPIFLLVILSAGLTEAFAGTATPGIFAGNFIANLLAASGAVLSSTLWVECYMVLSGQDVPKDELVEIFA